MRDHGMGHRVGRIVGMTIVGVFGAVFLGLVLGYLVQYLWNWLMPSIFGVGKITYWQAFGLIILAKLLFGGMGHHPGDPCNKKPHFHRECLPEEYQTKGDWQRRDRYNEWWHEEGKASFESFLENPPKKNEGEE